MFNSTFKPDKKSIQIFALGKVDLVGFNKESWWAHQDLNLEPTDYESAALTIEL